MPGWLAGLLLALPLLLLQGCSTPRPPAAAGANASPTEFILSGRVAAQYEDYDTGRKGELYGRFDWVEEAGSIELTLIDPLGQALARIVSKAATAGAVARTTVTLRNGESYSDRSPEALTRRTLGWSLPLSGLQHWLRGRAGTGAEVTRDAAGRITRIREEGWTIRYEHPEVNPAPPAAAGSTPNAATTTQSGAAPPERIDLIYYGPGPQISLRLALDP